MIPPPDRSSSSWPGHSPRERQSMTADLLPIGKIAEATGLAVSTIRYYDERGVISATTRVGGKRRFGPEAVGRVNFIQRAQEADFSLDEIQALLDDEAGNRLRIVRDKIAQLTGRRERLDEMITMLHEIQTCGCEAVDHCARVQSM